MEQDLIDFLNYIYENCTDVYGHLEMTREEIKGYESESAKGIVTEYLKQKENVFKNKN